MNGNDDRVERCRSQPGRAEWVAAVPRLLAECAAQWSLRLGAAYADAAVSYVTRAETTAGAEVVLKLQLPDRESAGEAEALTRWDGDGAVRLVAHDPRRHALLLERCDPGEHLSSMPPQVALDALIGLLPRLWVPIAAARIGSLQSEAHHWRATLQDQWEQAGRPFEAALLDAGLSALAELAGSQGEQVLLHQDLHGDNVLSARREPWLVIDPKPLIGEREFGLAPIVRSYEFGHSRETVIGRLDRLSELLGLDRERARLWSLGQTLAWSFERDQALPRHVETARWLAAAG